MPHGRTQSEAEMHAEMDAGTLAEAGVINTDKKRFAAAKKAAIPMVKEVEAKAQALRKVVKKKIAKKVPKKTTKKTGRRN